MNITDDDIDRGLRQLAPLAPDKSVWPKIVRELSPGQSFIARVRSRLPTISIPVIGGGLAAAVVLGVVYVFYFGAGAGVNWPGSELRLPQNSVNTASWQGGDQLAESSSSDVVSADDPDKTARGKRVRHLYGGDEALWDAMLEEEIYLVERAILQSAPEQQRKLWQYREKLADQLAALRYQTMPEKYLF